MENATLTGKAPKIWTVSDLNRLIKDVFDQTFYPFWVRGEVSNLTIHRSGHVYFTLKDKASQLAAVFFRGAATARDLGLKEGLEVEILGRLTVYEPRGQYQVIVDQLRTKGVGQLQQRFEELKEKLRAEGLFDPERKRAIPPFPRSIGVITSPEGAAIRDFLQILGRRFAGVQVRIFPAAVQGNQAAPELVAGIRFFNEQAPCDVLVLTRGGGSLEDLWPFNEESVARAVAASAIPVISAVGHEVDFTICDFVADLRAPTPSAAAELVIAKKVEILERIANLRRHLGASLTLQLTNLRRRLERAAGSAVLREPAHLVQRYAQRVDELSLRLGRALRQLHTTAGGRLDTLKAKLTMLSPHGVLSRGYAILLDRQTGRPLTAAADAPLGNRVRGVLAKGELELLVAGRKLE